MNEIDWVLVDRYLAGDASPEEMERVRRWLAESRVNPLFLAGVRRATAEASLCDSAVERYRAEVWERLRRELGDRVGGVPVPERAASRWRRIVRNAVQLAARICRWRGTGRFVS